MTPDQQQYIDDMRDLFITEGWQWVVADCKGLEQQYNQLDSINTPEQLHFAKGVLFAVRSIMMLPDAIRDAEEANEDA